MSTEMRVHFVIVQYSDESHGIGVAQSDKTNTVCKESGVLLKQVEHTRVDQIAATASFIHRHLRGIEPLDMRKEVHIHVVTSPGVRVRDYSHDLAALKQEIEAGGTTTVEFHALKKTRGWLAAAHDTHRALCEFPSRNEALDECIAMAMHCALTWTVAPGQ